MFLIQYARKLIVFVLGFLIPPANETKENEDKFSELTKDGKPTKKKVKLSWSDRYAKLRMLYTIYWPEADFSIQIRMFGSIVVMLLNSSVNVLVAVYNQRIGKTKSDVH